MSDQKKTLLSHNTNNFQISVSTGCNKCFNPNSNSQTESDSAEKENLVPSVSSTGFGHGQVLNLSSVPLRGRRPVSKTQFNKGTLNLKPSSLQVCMKLNDSDSVPGGVTKWDPIPYSSDIWEFSDSEPAPASSWSTLPNRSLLCRSLPLDVGRCTCIIAKEQADGARGVAIYSLYTNEGHGRQDRKLAVARHRRRRGKSEIIVAQNLKGIFSSSDESFLGSVTANLVGSKYQIFDQGRRLDSPKNQPKKLLGVVAFAPTITTLTGRFRSIRAWIPKQQQFTQLKNTNATTHIQHINGLPKDWEVKKNRADKLVSRIPFYNNITKRYELDFRERAGRTSYRVQTSVKNFQMTMEEKGRQTILQLGRIGKSKYIMDFRYPLTGYQAFCICLASIDSKLCCTL